MTQVHLKVAPVCTQTYRTVIFRVAECIIRIDIFSSWQHPHVGSINCEARGVMVRKSKWKPLKLTISEKILQ